MGEKCDKCGGSLYFDEDVWEPYCPRCRPRHIVATGNTGRYDESGLPEVEKP
jgi:Zn finger protein HypA/HybF involved in hydrogenase expression